MPPSTSISGVINFDRVRIKGDMAHVTMVLPFAALATLKEFFNSAASLSSFVNTKATHKKALTRSQDSGKADRERRYQELVEKVMTSYRFHSGPGVTFRQAVRQVKDSLVADGQEITCGMIEILVKDNLKGGYRK